MVQITGSGERYRVDTAGRDRIIPPAAINSLAVNELVGQVQTGNVEALAILYDRYSGQVYSFLLRAVEPGLAEELLQDVFVALWHKANQYDPARGSFNAWFFTLVRHRLYDALPAYQKRRSEKSISEPSWNETLLQLTDERANMEDHILGLFRDEEVRQALQQLPPEQRQIILLSYFHGINQREIAQQLNLPLTTIKGRARLGLQKLRQILAVEY